MPDGSEEKAECSHCETSLRQHDYSETDSNVFCSTGCQSVYEILGPPENGNIRSDELRTTDDSEQSDDGQSSESPADTAEVAFLRVDGIHSATCEAFLESKATENEGVLEAEASYVSETIRITYLPDRISQSTLCETLSTLGYTAVPREEAPIDSNAAAEQGERRLDSALGYRYAAGIVFGSFLMLVYVVLLYPSQLSSLLGEGMLSLFAGGSGLGGGGVLALPLFLVLTGFVLVFTGLPLLRGAYVSVKMRQPTTELLATITIVSAYLYSTLAVLLGRADVFFDLTIVIAAVVVAAIFYESVIKRRAMDRLAELTISQIEQAKRYLGDGDTELVPVEDLDAGDRILVRQGERIPADGHISRGECTVDEAVVTGEFLPTVKRKGDEVVGGSIVTDDAAVVTVSDRETSSIDRLVEWVWDLQSADHGVHRLANRLATRSMLLIVGSAILAGGVLYARNMAAMASILGMLAAMFVVSPWALGLATPLSVATAIEQAMRRGIIVFDETIFERLREMDVVVFDKTGTLTTGQMSVIESDAPPGLLEKAAMIERRSSHPVAKAISDAYAPSEGTSDGIDFENGDAEGSSEQDPEAPIEEFTSHSRGIGGVVEGQDILVGHPDLFEGEDWEVPPELLERVEEKRNFGRIPVLVGSDGQAKGLIVVGDEPRDQWQETVTRLGERDIDIVVLTGDDEQAAAYFSQHPHVDHVFAGVPPAGKTATVRRLQEDGYVTMVGDGTNDAPAIGQADLGVALGSGTAIASDAADIAIVDNDLGAIETAFDFAYAAEQRIKQNTVLAQLYNVIAIGVALLGVLNPLLLMGAVVSTSGLLTANSFRSLLDG